MIDVQKGALVPHDELYGSFYTVFQSRKNGLLDDEFVKRLVHDTLHQGGNVLKMIIKRISVDSAIGHDVLDGYLAERTLVQQFEKGSFDCFFGKIRH